MKERKIRLKTVQDAKDFVAKAVKCDFDIDVHFNSSFIIVGKSILGVLSLDLKNVLTIRYFGDNSDFETFLDLHDASRDSAA